MKKILLGLVILFSVIGSNANNPQEFIHASKTQYVPDVYQFTSNSFNSEEEPGAAH